MENNPLDEESLSEETLDTLAALGEVLLRIRKRMLSEGFDVVNGKVVTIKKINNSEQEK